MGNIEIVLRDIAALDTDAVVNAANQDLRPGSGVCGAIFAAAGFEALRDACRAIGHCDTGSAVITPGFALKAKYVIHAVGPVWTDGLHGEPALLYGAYARALALAEAHGCRSVGFPLISTGVFGYPVAPAWETALRACAEHPEGGGDLQIVFAVRNRGIYARGIETLREIMEKRGDATEEASERIVIKKMETEDEIKGKAFVHWKSWQEAYPGMIGKQYLDRLTIEKCEQIAFNWQDGMLIAKDGERVIGFVGYGHREEDSPECGEVFALYVLSEYYGKGVGLRLMEDALERLKGYAEICLWTLKENKRAIRFYRKCGFVPDGREKTSKTIAAEEIRMVLKRQATVYRCLRTYESE